MAKVPDPISACLVAGSLLVTNFADKLPESLQTIGLWSGMGLTSIGVIYFVLFHIKEWIWPSRAIYFEKVECDERGCNITIKGGDALDKCLIKVEDIYNAPCIYPTSELPMALKTYHQTERGESGRFSLSSGERKKIPLLKRNIPNSNVVTDCMAICYERDLELNFLPEGEYIIHLVAYSEKPPTKQKIKVWVNSDKETCAEFID